MNDLVVNALIEERDRFAKEALTRVGHGDPAYEYGYRIGVYAGLERSIMRILRLYQDEKGEVF